MRLNAYLVFDGHCEVAFKFYEQILGGKIEAMVSRVGTPMEQQVPPERRNKILNARLILGDAVLMGMVLLLDVTNSQRVSGCHSRSTATPKPNASFMLWRKTGAKRDALAPGCGKKRNCHADPACGRGICCFLLKSK